VGAGRRCDEEDEPLAFDLAARIDVLSNKGAAVAGADRLAVRRPLGMASPGYWLLDSTGMQAAFAGLNMTARDFAKLGDLFRTGGVWQGRQIVTAW
jgi:CubicO group peptidase (beta-lactamase class C family)